MFAAREDGACEPGPVDARAQWQGERGVNTGAGGRGRPATMVVAMLVVTLLTAGCAPLAPKSSEAAATTTPTSTPTPTQEPSATPTTQAPAPAETTAAVQRTGAAARVPRAVITRQLAMRAERVAADLATASPEVLPEDIDPSSNRALGYKLMREFGAAPDQWQYLDALWQRESGWNHLAQNPTSSAYGIPQSLPGEKMAVVAPDWRTNPETQITWGLAYIAARYGNPQGAWAHSERVGWY